MSRSRGSALGLLNWGIVTGFVLFQFFMQTVAGIMARRWRIEFDLTPLQIGNLSAAFFYIYVSLQIPVGFIYDRLPTKWVLATASFILAYACYLMSGAQSYAEALLARVLMGAASAFGFVGMLYVVAQWFEGRRFVFMVGLSETFSMIGVAVSEVVMSSVVMEWGWRLTTAMAAVFALGLCILVLLFVQDNHHSEMKKTSVPVWSTLLYLCKQPTVMMYSFYGFTMFSLINVFATLWGIPFLRHQHHGMNLTQAASLVSMIYIGVAIGCPTITWFVSRCDDRKPIMLGCAVITTVLLTLVLFGSSLPVGVLYPLLFLTAFFSSTYILSFDFTKAAVPKKMQGVCLAFTNMIIMLAAPLLQLVVGSNLHRGWSYPLSLSVLPILIICSAVFILRDNQRAVSGSA